MISAPRTQEAWIGFVGSLAVLYAGVVFSFTDTGPVQSILLGGFYGLSMAIPIAILVVVWRGVPELLYPDEYEGTPRE